MEHLSAWQVLQGHFEKPEYLHILLNPLPIYGLAMGVLALVLGMFARSRAAQVIALSIIALSAAMAWPVAIFGQQSFDTIEARSDHLGAHWLDAHAQRATRALPAFYALAVFAAVAAALPWKVPKSALPLNLVTLLFSCVVLGLGAWIAFAGGQARHKEFRYPKNATPPEKLGGYEEMGN